MTQEEIKRYLILNAEGEKIKKYRVQASQGSAEAMYEIAWRLMIPENHCLRKERNADWSALNEFNGPPLFIGSPEYCRYDMEESVSLFETIMSLDPAAHSSSIRHVARAFFVHGYIHEFGLCGKEKSEEIALNSYIKSLEVCPEKVRARLPWDAERIFDIRKSIGDLYYCSHKFSEAFGYYESVANDKWYSDVKVAWMIKDVILRLSKMLWSGEGVGKDEHLSHDRLLQGVKMGFKEAEKILHLTAEGVENPWKDLNFVQNTQVLQEVDSKRERGFFSKLFRA